MFFGVVLHPDPPFSRAIELTAMAECSTLSAGMPTGS